MGMWERNIKSLGVYMLNPAQWTRTLPGHLRIVMD